MVSLGIFFCQNELSLFEIYLEYFLKLKKGEN